MLNPEEIVKMIANLVQKEKLTKNTFFRLGLNFYRSKIEEDIKNLDLNSLPNNESYHLYTFFKDSTLPELEPNQIQLYLNENNILYAKFYKKNESTPREQKIFPTTINGLYNGVVSSLGEGDTEFTRKFNKIHQKITKGIPLSKNEVEAVFNEIGVTQNTHPILQTMDEYIFSMEKKLTAGHINQDMAQDKIEFTKVLRIFIENPVQENWIKVRNAMRSYPRYAFSWTGSSQADLFLSFVKIQHKEKIQAWDSDYRATHRHEASTSWGRFVYNFGWMYYVPSLFLVPFKLVHYFIKAYQQEELQNQIVDIHSKMILTQTKEQNKLFKKEAEKMLTHLKTYLSESEQITEEVLSYIDEFEEHISELKKIAGNTNSDFFNKVNEVHQAILKLVDRPIPSVDISCNR